MTLVSSVAESTAAGFSNEDGLGRHFVFRQTQPSIRLHLRSFLPRMQAGPPVVNVGADRATAQQNAITTKAILIEDFMMLVFEIVLSWGACRLG
jgi:hypothetical protein